MRIRARASFIKNVQPKSILIVCNIQSVTWFSLFIYLHIYVCIYILVISLVMAIKGIVMLIAKAAINRDCLSILLRIVVDLMILMAG